MKKPDFIVVDLETTGLDWKKDRVHGVGIATDEDDTFYDAVSYKMDGGVRPIISARCRELLEDPAVAKVGHNLRFDMRFLLAAGINVQGAWHDTKLMAKSLNEHQPLGLKALSQAYRISSLEVKSELDKCIYKLKLKHVGELCELDLREGARKYFDLIGRYCREDCNNTYKLFLILREKLKEKDVMFKERFGLKKTPLDAYREEIAPLEPILVDMEMRGVAINKHYQRELGNRLFKEAAQLEARLKTDCATEISSIQRKMADVARSKRVTQKAKDRIIAGAHKEATFSWRSPKQVSDLVYKELRVPPRFWEKTEKGQLSVGSKARPRLMLNIRPKHRAYGVLESYEALYRAKDQYSKFVDGDSKAALNVVEYNGRIHGQFVQEPKTGRLSHQAPNMGNIPRGDVIKKLFVPDPGHVFWYFDYSQVEFRILAHLSQDPNMIEACKSDPHTKTAELCGVDRATAKTINFAFLYGAMAKKAQMIFLVQAGQWKSLEECEELRRRFFAGYSELMPYLERVKKVVRTYGFSATPTGYVRRFPEVFDAQNKWDVMSCERKGVNLLGQGFGASIMKRAMINLYDAGYTMVSQVHDSAIGMLKTTENLEEHKKNIELIAQSAYTLRVPLVAEVKFLNSFAEGDLYGYAELGDRLKTHC